MCLKLADSRLRSWHPGRLPRVHDARARFQVPAALPRYYVLRGYPPRAPQRAVNTTSHLVLQICNEPITAVHSCTEDCLLSEYTASIPLRTWYYSCNEPITVAEHICTLYSDQRDARMTHERQRYGFSLEFERALLLYIIRTIFNAY